MADQRDKTRKILSLIAVELEDLQTRLRTTARLSEDEAVRDLSDRVEMLLAATVSVLALGGKPDRDQVRNLVSFIRRAVEGYGIEVSIVGHSV